MARGRQEAAAQIYEDPEPPKQRKTHKRTPSVGDMLRGRKKDASPTKMDLSRHEYNNPSPLGERHINSPPQPTRVPLKQESSRPPMHKKTGSSVSLKDLIMGKERQDDSGSVSSTEARTQSPKKNKSTVNLSGLLKKKSKKDLQAETRNQENISPTKQHVRTPLWEQLATQPLQSPDGNTMYPASHSRTVDEEIALYTPKDYSEFRLHEQRNFYGFVPSPLDYKPPQRPQLEHKSSRSSIFTENLEDEHAPPLQRPKSRDHNDSRPGSSRIADMRSKFEQPSTPGLPDQKEKRKSKVLDVISTFNMRSRDSAPPTPQAEPSVSPQELETAFEKVLEARNIPHNMRDTMRQLKPELKLALMRGDRSGSESSTTSTVLNDVRSSAGSRLKKEDRTKSEEGDGKRARSRSRPRSGVLSWSKRDDSSPVKADKSSTRSRSKSRPKSVDLTNIRPTSSRSLGSSGSTTSLAAADIAATPGDFIHYLQEVQKPSLIEVGKLHKLRILLRNESVNWTDTFVRKGGMNELISLLYRITKIEWREEHEDNLLHETLLCLKALCTTSLAMVRFAEIEDEFFPTILSMLFDPERKGPSEFNTRGVIVSLLFSHLCSSQASSPEILEARARKVLTYLADPSPSNDKQPHDFLSQMHTSRPYKVWCKEVVNVTKEVFWIFLHHYNVIPIPTPTNDDTDGNSSYIHRHFPAPRPPHPAAPYVGGVEWEATTYLSIHLDLINGLIASLPTKDARNALREELKQSGFEKVMGGSLRTCKEKFYAGVHDGLKLWVGTARDDGWEVEDVRAGPPRDGGSPRKSPVKKGKVEEAPKISLDVGVVVERDVCGGKLEDAWV
jgi:hypothetical protein